MRTLVVLLTAVFLSVSNSPLYSYPEKPITIVVPLPAGSIPDVVARMIGDQLSKRLNTPVIVMNRPGAGLNIGARAVAAADPDGYTLLLTAPGPLVTNQFLYSNLPYNPEAFEPISVVAKFGFVLATKPDIKAQSLQDLVELARLNPGGLFVASTGPGSPPHLIAEMFQKAAKIKLTSIQYPGLSTALNDVTASRVDLIFCVVGDAVPLIKDGKLRVLGHTDEQEVPELPNVPKISDTFPGFSASSFFALVAPPNTSSEIIVRLSKEVNAIVNEGDLKNYLMRIYMDLANLTPVEAQNYLRVERARWKEAIQSAGIKPE